MGNFRCPQCQKATLEILQSLELPPDGDSDENTLQLIRCGSCGLSGAAAYMESRRGAGESVDHVGVALSDAAYATLAEQLARCPAPRDRRCGCTVHEQLFAQERGRWRGLQMFGPIGQIFGMVWR